MPSVVPGDAAKAAGSFEDEIMVRCLAHQIALAFRSTIELVRASREFNPILAFSVAAEKYVRPVAHHSDLISPGVPRSFRPAFRDDFGIAYPPGLRARLGPAIGGPATQHPDALALACGCRRCLTFASSWKREG